MASNSEHLFDSIVLSQAFKRVFAQHYGIEQVSSTVTFKPNGYDVEHVFNSAEFHGVCDTRQITPEDLVEAVRLQVEVELDLHLADAPASVRH